MVVRATVELTEVDMNRHTGAGSFEKAARELHHTALELAEAFGANLPIDIYPRWNLEPRILSLRQKCSGIFRLEGSIRKCRTGRGWWWGSRFGARADVGGQFARNSRAHLRMVYTAQASNKSSDG